MLRNVNPDDQRVGPDVPTLLALGVATGIPFIGFGFLDNFIMVTPLCMACELWIGAVLFSTSHLRRSDAFCRSQLESPLRQVLASSLGYLPWQQLGSGISFLILRGLVLPIKLRYVRCV
jgi:hypothetical protein